MKLFCLVDTPFSVQFEGQIKEEASSAHKAGLLLQALWHDPVRPWQVTGSDKVKWQQVTFKDPDASAVNLEEFSVVFCSLNGPGMVEMALALQRVGKTLDTVIAPVGIYHEAGLSTRKDLFYGSTDPWPCTCGACLRCLE